MGDDFFINEGQFHAKSSKPDDWFRNLNEKILGNFEHLQISTTMVPVRVVRDSVSIASLVLLCVRVFLNGRESPGPQRSVH